MKHKKIKKHMKEIGMTKEEIDKHVALIEKATDEIKVKMIETVLKADKSNVDYMRKPIIRGGK